MNNYFSCELFLLMSCCNRFSTPEHGLSFSFKVGNELHNECVPLIMWAGTASEKTVSISIALCRLFANAYCLLMKNQP